VDGDGRKHVERANDGEKSNADRRGCSRRRRAKQIWKETRFLRVPDSFAIWWAPF
jgi:hypothetical protein